jgi:5-(carboxyamino)imidazole ribonucleotide synthase
MDASVTSQFQQQVRAMARLPLGDTRLLTPVSMLNLLGELWFTMGTDNTVPQEPDWANALSHDSAKLHLYGKSVPLPGRKMGHINCLGASPAEARQIAAAVASDLGIEP